MPTLSALPSRTTRFVIPLEQNWRAHSPFHGRAGRELDRLAEKVWEYWIASCEQLHVLRAISEETSYRSIPPKRSFTVSVHYHLRGRGEPLPYSLNDEE